jgi:hypothetical protein
VLAHSLWELVKAIWLPLAVAYAIGAIHGSALVEWRVRRRSRGGDGVAPYRATDLYKDDYPPPYRSGPTPYKARDWGAPHG